MCSPRTKAEENEIHRIQRRTRSTGDGGGWEDCARPKDLPRLWREERLESGKKVLGVRGSSKATIGQCSRTTREERHIFPQNFKALDMRITFFIYLTLYQTLECNPAPPPCRTRALLPRVGGVWGSDITTTSQCSRTTREGDSHPKS